MTGKWDMVMEVNMHYDRYVGHGHVGKDALRQVCSIKTNHCCQY